MLANTLEHKPELCCYTAGSRFGTPTAVSRRPARNLLTLQLSFAPLEAPLHDASTACDNSDPQQPESTHSPSTSGARVFAGSLAAGNVQSTAEASSLDLTIEVDRPFLLGLTLPHWKRRFFERDVEPSQWQGAYDTSQDLERKRGTKHKFHSPRGCSQPRSFRQPFLKLRGQPANVAAGCGQGEQTAQALCIASV